MREQLAQLLEVARADAARLVRVEPERREDAVVLLAERQARAAGLDRRPHGDNALDPGLARAPENLPRILEGVEMGVCVDHGPEIGHAASRLTRRPP